MFEHFIDPLITKIGILELRYYGILFALGVFTGYMIFRHLFRIQGYKVSDADSLFIYLIVGIVIGIRLVHCFFYDFDYYMKNPIKILYIWEGGLASHGSVLGVFAALWIFKMQKKNQKYTIFQITDLLVIPFMFGSAFIRLGNFFNSEIVGRETDLPWGVLFTRDRMDYIFQVYRHPSQVYEMLIGIGLFILLYTLFIRLRHRLQDGFIFLLGLGSYFFARFMVEYVKEFQNQDPSSLFTIGQMLSIPFFVVAFAWILIAKKYKLKPVSEAVPNKA